MLRTFTRCAFALACIPAAWCQATAVQPPFSSNYTLVSLGPVNSFALYYGSLTFLNASTLLMTDGVEGGTVTIYQIPVTRGTDGHIASLGTPVSFASGPFLDSGLAFGPADVLFGNGGRYLSEWKPGSTVPDLTVDLSTFGFPSSAFGPLQFVPPGLPGAGLLKVVAFGTGGWYDVGLSPNASGTYDVSAVTGPNATANADVMSIFYVPLGSPQFGSPSVLVSQYYSGPIYTYTVDVNGNPSGTGTPFIAGGSFCPYGAAFDPITGDMLFTTTLSGEDVYQVEGFSPGILAATAGKQQSALVDKHFASPLTVTLKDPYGTPVSGVTIGFSAPSSGATAALSSNGAVTAADGTASVTATANGTAGAYSITASLYGHIATFSLTNVAIQGVDLSPAAVVGGHSTTANTIGLTSAAPASGATISLTSSNPAVAAVPASVTVTGGATVSAPFTITTTAVAALTNVVIKAGGANQKTAVLSVKAAALTSLKLAPASVVGGKSTTGNTVSLNGPAPAAGAVVDLSSSDPAVAAVPSSVTIASGATTSPAFTITTSAVAAQTPVTISATYNGATKTAVLTVNSPQIASLRLSPASVKGGHPTTHNTVTLNGPAPAGGAAVLLTSGNSTVAAVPSTVTVAAGATSATFTITTTPVTANTVVPITATFGGISKMANLTVTP